MNKYLIARWWLTKRGLLIILLIVFVVIWYRTGKYEREEILNEKLMLKSGYVVKSYVNIIDVESESLDRNFSCITTKKIFDLYETTLCLHSSGDGISDTVKNSRIWEESEVRQIMKILIRNPNMDMIDIGANIGGFTMFTAGALGRFTLAVDCYLPNIEKIARAVQIQKVKNRVVLVQNALYRKSNEDLYISSDDPSGIRLSNDSYKTTQTGQFIPNSIQFIAKSIHFDDLLPILEKHRVRTALIKIDIETSESYMCETGSKIFNSIDIPFVMMEWHSGRINHQDRYLFIIDFFIQRNYIPTNEQCSPLVLYNWLNDWPGIVFWIKKSYLNQTFC